MKKRACISHVLVPLIGLLVLFISGCSSSMNSMRPPEEAIRRPGSQATSVGGMGLSAFASAPEELWILARGSTDSARTMTDLPGSGELLALTSGLTREVPLPLKHTDVHASVTGYISTVDVKQEFENPYDTKIEAVYVFPLPHDAAVSEFIMTIGERRIRGIIRERKEAEEIYQQAKSQGYTASLLTEERPNIFKQSVANIEPGKQIDVEIKYFQTLAYADGWYEFVFPMVVGPRYNPPGSSTGVGAVARGQAGISAQGTEVQYLAPDERSGHDISLHLDISAGVRIEEFDCVTHRLNQEASDSKHLSVSLAPDDRIPNKDFVLRFRVAGEAIKSDLLVQRDERGDYFTLMLLPPRDPGALRRAPLEMVFVLDCSGSMAGRPIEQAKTAITRALSQLQPADSFQIINFSERASQLGDEPLEATPANIQKGLSYVAALNGDGPTEMIEGIRAALDFPHDPERLRFVCFLTDGFIGNEAEILRAVHEQVGASRIFSFGVGSGPNRYLLDHMAKLGRGAVAYLGLQDDAAKVMDDFFERISHPALTDIQVNWGNLRVSEIYPSQVPDLFVGRPVILTGRWKGGSDNTISVTGQTDGQPMEIKLPADLSNAGPGSGALPKVWARSKIAELADRTTYDSNPQLPQAIRRVAVDYELTSAFTAFLAVDATQATEENQAVTVPVAVPVPDGVRYDTTVRDKAKQKEQPQ